MSKAYKKAAAVPLAFSAAALIAMAGSAAAAASAPPPARYCLLYDHGGADCGFASKARCEATAFDQGGECYRDVFGDGRELYW